MSKDISEATRRDLIDYITVSGVRWAGRLRDREFLSRLYDLTVLPSNDSRFGNAAGDIMQHTENWTDWEPTWVFDDSRFNLRHCSDEELMRFLAEMLHPVVRQDSGEARDLAQGLNRILGVDGWRLVERGETAGRPIFVPERTTNRVVVFPEPTGWQKVDRQMQEATLRLHSAGTEEQFQAVGLMCREVLITVSQVAFDPKRHGNVDGVSPSATDAKRMLEAIFEGELAGSANEEARSHAKAAVKLAYALQHKRTADFRLAALCAEATAAVVNLIAILADRRT